MTIKNKRTGNEKEISSALWERMIENGTTNEWYVIKTPVIKSAEMPTELKEMIKEGKLKEIKKTSKS